MALFKPMVGTNETALTQKEKVAGYVWFTTDDGKFYIDWKDGNNTLHRSVLNAGHADTATQDGDGNVISQTYLKKSGGTILGDLFIANNATNTSIRFIPTDISKEMGSINYNITVNSPNTGFRFVQYSRSSTDYSRMSKYEVYQLPYTQANLTENKWYHILTTKNTVSIEQGGTGATTAAGARTALEITPANINAVSKSGDTMTGDLRIGTISSTDGYYLRMQRAVGDTYYVGRFYIHGTSGAASVQTTKGTSAVNYMYLEEDRTVFKQPVNIGSGGTGSSTRTGAWDNIVAGAGIFSGTPVIANASYYGSLWFKATKITSGGENRNAVIYAWTGTSAATDLSYTRFSFRQYSANANATTMSSIHEEFYLPQTNQGLSSNKTYDILTTKSAVTIEQGGTNATTASDARTNLNVPSRTGSGASGTWGINITGNARMVSRSFDRDDSNATNLIRIYDTNGTTIRCLLGAHNLGGDGTGALYLIPYPPTEDSWSGNEGLYIGKGILKLDGQQVLTAANYNNYSPTKTGAGASGTWGINVTGSSASCTGNAASATKLQTARTIFGQSFNGTANVAGKAYVYGSYNATVNNRYGTGAIEIRENGLVGNAQSDIAYAPQIGFHWANRCAGQLALNSSGQFCFIKQDGTTATVVANLSGNASTATALTTSAGSSSSPIYFSGGKPVQCGRQPSTNIIVEYGPTPPTSGNYAGRMFFLV